MKRSGHQTAKTPLRRALMVAVGTLALAIPSTGFAIAGFGGVADNAARTFDLFTPTSVDPELAARVATKARERGIRFTPAGTSAVRSERTVTVAVRIDDESAQAITVRSAAVAAKSPGRGTGLAAIDASRFNLGTARGYQRFARSQTDALAAAPAARAGITLPDNVRKLSVPDLSAFEPPRSDRGDRASRLQPRIELEDQRVTGRSPNTLDSLGAQTVDVGGSFRLSRNLDVTAGVRLSQERDRLDPVTDSVQDSQAVYVGTQIRF